MIRSETPRSNTLGVRTTLDELIALRFEAAGLNLSNRRKLMSLMAGGYQSGFRGRGIDFAETRHYQPGDDVRSLDWRVTARTGHPHTKIYQEERERPVLMLVDYGPSMAFGTRVAFKSVIAARTAAILGWIATTNGDRVGGMIMSPTDYRDVRPGGGRRGVLRFLKQLADGAPEMAAPQATTDYLNQGLMQARRVAHPGSLVCIVSDFQTLNEDGERHLRQLAKHADVLAVYVYDALERELPPPAQYMVSDGQHTTRIDTGDASFRRQYQTFFDARYSALETLFKQQAMRLLPLATHEPITDTLRRGLSLRAAPVELSPIN